MKRIGYIYEKIYDKENIRKAIMKASEHKRKKPGVKKVLDNMEWYIDNIQQMLINETFQNSPCSIEEHYEQLSGKVRILRKPRFYPDQIVHWCVMLQLTPLFMKGMDPHNCGNVPGRGEKHIRLWLRRNIKKDPKGTKWVLKYDIRHFYESVDHKVLMEKLERKIKDKKVLKLLKTIIEFDPVGLPLGTYTSQWLANFYLQSLDHYTREQLKATHMYRYADDVVILGSNKRKLYKMQKAIEEYLNSEKLEMKNNWAIFQLSKRDIDFVGYRYHSNGRITIRKRIWKNIRAIILRIHHHGLCLKRAMRFMSYNGYVKNSNSQFIQSHYYNLVEMKKIRQCVSQESRRKTT